ncbi:hypothetical protein BJX62DRAFT_238558 [Aspergillus germanicus]
MEGDTPTFLFLIQNGLGSPEHPHWGSWGGRYGRVSLDGNHYADVKDEVIGVTGKKAFSNHTTIWRWRDAFQDDFAARMQWTMSSDRSKANHAPVIVVNGTTPGPEYLYLEVEAGSVVRLDASESYDPDADELSFVWFQYKEPTRTQSDILWRFVGDVEITPANADAGKPNAAVVEVHLPPAKMCAVNILTGEALEKRQSLHLILEVKDDAELSMRAYKRIVLQVTNMGGQGASGKVFETVTDALGHSVG